MLKKSNIIKAVSDLIFIKDPETTADLIIVPGSSHVKLPLKATDLYKKGLAKKIVFTGCFNQKLMEVESEWYFKLAVKVGVPEKDILLESKSTNTKENAVEAFKLIKTKKIPHKKIILVSKPHHSRRLKMTFSNVFKKSDIFIIPSVDDRKIEKNNWWKDKGKTQIVIEEVGKISEYYLKGDLSLK